jgi:hypothetical protein
MLRSGVVTRGATLAKAARSANVQTRGPSQRPRGALGYRPLSTLVPYDVPQAWARAFRPDGFEGVRYAVRCSRSRRRESYALFHDEGVRPIRSRGHCS